MNDPSLTLPEKSNALENIQQRLTELDDLQTRALQLDEEHNLLIYDVDDDWLRTYEISLSERRRDEAFNQLQSRRIE